MLEKQQKIVPRAFHAQLPTNIVQKIRSGARQTRFSTVLGASWARLGRFSAALGRPCAPLGRFLAAPWALLGAFWLVLGASWELPWNTPLFELGMVGHQFGASPVWSEKVL